MMERKKRKPSRTEFTEFCETIGLTTYRTEYLWEVLEDMGWRASADFVRHPPKLGWKDVTRDWVRWHEAYHVYTDGSAWFHPFKKGVWCGGSAYVIIYQGEVIRQSNYGNTETTNNRMEMLAIICGVGHCPEGADVVVHSDSQYSLKVLSGWWNAKANTDLVAMYKKHSASKGKIWYNWVKGHAGYKYNELCDRLANEGRIRAMRDAGLDWKKALESTNKWREAKGEAKIAV